MKTTDALARGLKAAGRGAKEFGGILQPTHAFFSFKNAFLSALATSAIAFFLFQKKLLPKPVSKIVAKLFFYPSFPVTALKRLDNYWTVIDDTLFCGCAPMACLGHPSKMAKLGVKAVINMCDEYKGPVDAYSREGIKQLWLPTVDHFEPSLESMKDAVQFIEECKERREKVYVHCKAGHGRGAAIALCWMISQRPSESALDLNNELAAKRHVRKSLYKQPNIIAFRKHIQEKAAKRDEEV